MSTDILNLPKWDVIELEEGHQEYIIKARYTVQPSVCPSCGVMFPRLQRYGTKQQPFRDLPIHGKRVRLLVVKKRWKCQECKRVFWDSPAGLYPHSRMTERLAAYVIDHMRPRHIAELAREIGVDEGTLRHFRQRQGRAGRTRDSTHNSE